MIFEIMQHGSNGKYVGSIIDDSVIQKQKLFKEKLF